MNLFLLVRDALGLSQEAFAQLLGVSLSSLKMAETDRRTLPPQAMQRLVWMVGFVQNLPSNAKAPEFSTQTVAALLLQTRKKKRETDELVGRLDTKRKQMQNRLAFETAFSVQFPSERHAGESARVNALTIEARSHLKYSADDELELRARQAGLAAMLTFLEAL